jgi:hypothetical protein
MEVKDMFKQPKFSKLNSLLENRYDFSFNTTSLTRNSARHMLKLVESKISAAQHIGKNIEKAPAYCQMLLMRESLHTWLKEQQLTEGELGEAEVVLAAKTLTDSIQKMVEQAGKIVNEELPALSVAIRDQIGMSQADAYKTSVGNTVTELLSQLTAARDQLESSYLALTGQQESSAMAMPAAAQPGAVTDEAMPPQDAEDGGDEFAATDAEAGGTAPAGRDRR